MRTGTIIILGGGQGGLAMGSHLARQDVESVILDAAPQVGHAWRDRWDSLTLFTPAVVWATGFRPDFGWIEAPVLDARGGPVHRRGVTSTPGLYFLGLSWLHTRGSALLGWVGRDAEYLSGRIVEYARGQTAASSPAGTAG